MLTITEAAAELGVTPGNLRVMVNRGKLQPVNPGGRPLTFWPSDVHRLAQDRDTQRQDRDTLKRAASRFWAEVV